MEVSAKNDEKAKRIAKRCAIARHRNNIIIQELCEKYPLVFDRKKPKPMAINILEKILKENPDMGRNALKRALGQWVKRIQYVREMSRGTHRYRLDGSEGKPITDVHKASSRKALKEFKKVGK